MEETLTGYVTEISVTTHNKGKLTFIVGLYLFFVGRYVGTERMFHDFLPSQHFLILRLSYQGSCGHGGEAKYILGCSIG